MSFDYNADIYGNMSVSEIRDHARSLLGRLKYREAPANRPIVFAAHSLGGIVLKQVIRYRTARPALFTGYRGNNMVLTRTASSGSVHRAYRVQVSAPLVRYTWYCSCPNPALPSPPHSTPRSDQTKGFLTYMDLALLLTTYLEDFLWHTALRRRP